MKPEQPANEEQRLTALRSYEILDTDSERQFDDLTLLASHICGTPIATISLVDENRQWFKSRIGLAARESSRDTAFCAHGILQPDIFVVQDAQLDSRFADNPFVTGDTHIRFYAGAPLKTSDGHALGMICVVDRVPRELSADQAEALRALSRQVVAQMELKKSSLVLRKTVDDLEKTKENLRARTAFFEAQAYASIEGIVVVDRQGRKILQNPQMGVLWKIPGEIADDPDDARQLEWVAQATEDPAAFIEKVRHLYAHPDEVSRDEIRLKDGTILDRYSSPVVGHDGTHYGRIWSFYDTTRRTRIEESLHLLESAVQQAKESILITDAQLDLPGPRIVFANPAFTRMTGYSLEEILGKTPRLLQGPRTDRAVMSRLRETLSSGGMFEGETINYRKGGAEFYLNWQAAPIRDADGTITHFVAIQRDVTESKKLEIRMFQSQKMETVAKLAGGIAHEFNSILTAIIGQSELMLTDLAVENPLATNAREIGRAAQRAAILTQQLLAYARKQIMQPEVIDLNLVVKSLLGTLQHLMGRQVEVEIILAPALKTVKIDPGQIEQVIVNIAMNSGDAMPNGGKLIIETANTILDEEFVRPFPGLRPGGYVLLAMTDTGAGMSEEVKARAFEPFFSTKDVRSGAGLGLATCYGIVKQSEGQITCYSELARGTTLKIYLPQFEQDPHLRPSHSRALGMPGGTETILIAEDDPSLLEMSSALLRRLGYTVLTAANGMEALSLKQSRDIGYIDLLLTDVVMPHMSGKELSDRIRLIYPRTKILFTSAYTENAIVHHGVLNEGVMLLQKPFTPSALARKVREALEQTPDRE